MINREMGPVRLSFFFVGCFLGAGYLSGREIWEFFGDRGIAGFICILPSVLILLLTGLIILFLSRKACTRVAEDLVIPFASGALKTVFSVIQALFLVNIAVLMTSGAASLMQQLFGLDGYIGGAVFAVVTILFSIMGIRGVIRVFSMTIPFLTLFVLMLTLYILCKDAPLLSFPETKSSGCGALGLSALLYAAYNLFGSVPLIASVSDRVSSNKARVGGLLMGALLLLLIAVCVFLCQAAVPASTVMDLPLLYIATNYHPLLGMVFAVLLLCAMFGTALSTVVAANDMMGLKWAGFAKHPLVIAAIECVLLLLGSFFHFGDLVSVVYPIFGYLGIALIVMLIIRFFSVLKKRES